MEIAEKIKATAHVIAHCGIAVAAVFCAGFGVSLFEPIIGQQRYSNFVHGKVALVLLFLLVAITGGAYYQRWRDAWAMYAWVVPGLVSLYYLLFLPISGDARLSSKLYLAVLVLGITVAYSAGAALSAFWIQRRNRPLGERQTTDSQP